ncbi:MAG: TolC family outer membrane protein, partial [Proteobacteria bacterium]|nr:TolC family outer membrane protein [Pseudomonadota bacterium]
DFVAQARAEFEVAQQDLILRVAESYFSILAAQDVLEFARAEETAIARQLEQAQKRFEVGLIAITDVLEAQARYDSALAQTILSENQLDNAFQALEVIIGQTPSLNPARLSDNLELNRPVPAQSEPWVEIALQNNQSLLAALAAERAADHERQIKNKSRYPTLDFTASYSDADIEDDTLPDGEQQDLSLAILFNVPLYTGGRISAERAQAEAAYQSARSVALLQRRLTSQNTRIAYLGVISGISQVTALKQALKSSNTALEATEAGFDVGTRTSIDVLISLRATYAAQRDYAGARYQYLIDTLKLKQASGLLGTADLEQINRWLVDEPIARDTTKPAGTENLLLEIELSRIESAPDKADEPEELVVNSVNQQLTHLQRDLDNGLHWLESENKSRATIQIMMIGFRNFNAGDYYNYLDSLESQNIDVSGFRIYQTSINGSEVFGVIYGEYENRREASEHINKLPEALKARSPMPRTIGGILNEINGR